VKPLLRTLFLTLLIFAAAAPVYSQGGDSPAAPAQSFNQDLQFDNLTREGELTEYASVSANVVILTDEQGQYPLGLHLEILEDKDGTLTIDDVTSPEVASQFVASQQEAPNFGFSDSAFWVRFTVRNETADTTDWQLTFQRTTNLHFIDVYVPSSDQQDFMVTKTGTYLPFDTRDMKIPQYVFNVPLLPDAEQTIHIRIQSESLITFPLTLWSSAALLQKHRVELVLSGILFGVLLITLSYNTFLYLFLRDASYLYYVLFIACFFLQILSGDGLAQQYLWPNMVGWNGYAQPFFYLLGTALALKFTSSFFVTGVNEPKLYKLINILSIICVVAAISLPFGGLRFFNVGLFILVIVSTITMVVVGFIVWRRGYRPARYYLPAWSIFFVTATLIPLTGIDLLPNNLVTAQGYRFGLMVLVLLLSVALADRINNIRQQREEAQAELISTQQKTLELRNEFNIALQKTNETLEERVERRTKELARSKETAEATQAALQKANNELATVLSLSQDIVSTLELDTLLNLILDQLRQVVDYHGAGILTFKEEQLHFRAYQGMTIASRLGSLVIPVAGISPLRRAMYDRQPFIIDDVRQEPGLAQEFQEAVGLGIEALFGEAHAWLAVPLITGYQVIGLLGCTHREPGYYRAEALSLAQAFANQAAIALENAQLYEQAQAAAVVEERNRLARELHDSVTQSIYSASLVAEVLPEMWRREPDEAEKGLEDLRHLTRGALAEMRTMLLELRPTAVVKTPLADLLKQLAEAVTSRTELQPELNVEPVPTLPAEVHINFYRVAQEALNNVVKHAGASQVRIGLLSSPPLKSQPDDAWQGQVELCISDDGHGFDAAQIPLDRLGLGIMRERAGEIKAALTIKSQPDQGTVVTMIWENGESHD
jgi:two-component system nitrate/nitrite sensor histidine kinase NarX